MRQRRQQIKEDGTCYFSESFFLWFTEIFETEPQKSGEQYVEEQFSAEI